MNLHSVTCQDALVYPSKVVCVGRNYVQHIEELGNEVPQQMVVFIKPNSAISNTLHSVLDEPLHYEAEICFLLRNGRCAAVAAGLDLTKRELQGQLKKKGLPWERAKAFDGAALFSPFVEIEALPPALAIQLRIDGETVQQGAIDHMLFKPDQILAECRHFLTLNDNDIVMTGTPKGVGEVRAGAKYTASIVDGSRTLTSASWTAH